MLTFIAVLLVCLFFPFLIPAIIGFWIGGPIVGIAFLIIFILIIAAFSGS
jgi:hypothetical protein